jgi:hypothetical protein
MLIRVRAEGDGGARSVLHLPRQGAWTVFRRSARRTVCRRERLGNGPTRLFSIIVPVYNEEEYGSSEILDLLAAAHPGRVRVFHHTVNSGKGAAIRTGLQRAAGEFGQAFPHHRLQYGRRPQPHGHGDLQ